MQGTFFTLQFFGVIRASTDCISVRQLLLLGRRNDNAESDAAIIFWRHSWVFVPRQQTIKMALGGLKADDSRSY